MTTHNQSLFDATAEATTTAIINLLHHPISDDEHHALFEAIYTMVRAGLRVSFELYRLRLQHPTTN